MLLFSHFFIAIFSLLAAAQTTSAPTLRESLIASGSMDISLLPNDCLDAKAAAKGMQPYMLVACHLSPSAQQTFVLSRDGALKGSLYGCELATLPNGEIVYHDSEVHFASTHSLGVSIFDPATGNDKKIYPPMPYQPVRQAFIARVAEAYNSRGDDWFMRNNQPKNPELFDCYLHGKVTLDAVHKAILFTVQYGDPQNAHDPLPFTELVDVNCSPIDSLEQMHCVETAQH